MTARGPSADGPLALCGLPARSQPGHAASAPDSPPQIAVRFDRFSILCPSFRDRPVHRGSSPLPTGVLSLAADEYTADPKRCTQYRTVRFGLLSHPQVAALRANRPESKTADERADEYECVNECEQIDAYGRVNDCEQSTNIRASTDMNGTTDGKRDGERAERRHRDNAAARRPSCSAATYRASLTASQRQCPQQHAQAKSKWNRGET